MPKYPNTPAYCGGADADQGGIPRSVGEAEHESCHEDEPTGNLDERTGGEVMDLLLQSCEEEKAALILVTHNPTFAKATKESLFLRQGKFKNG